MSIPDQAPRVSIVIPARNEAGRLPGTIAEIRRAFPAEAWEFLVVVEPGDDDTAGAAVAAAAGDSRFQIRTNPTAHGKGHAVKTGMLMARGEWVFFMDADLSVPLRCVGEFLAAAGDADVLMGSRRHPESVIAIRQPTAREMAGRLFNRVLRAAGVTRFCDTQCGFKAFRREAAQKIFPMLRQQGFGFDVEVVVLAEVMGFRIKELPVEWADAPGSTLRPLRDGIFALRDAVLAARRIRREYRKVCQHSE